MRSLELEGKKIIVSGAANGIGAAVFRSLLEEGAYPIGIDLEEFKGSELAGKIGGYPWRLGLNFDFFQGDASDMTAMKQVLAGFESFDGLVNNAGLLGNDNVHRGRSVESLDKLMSTHVHSALVLTETAYPRMTRGSIVNIGSIEVTMAAPDMVLYAAAKGALLGMTVAYATTLAPKIRVNMVSPGNVNTERNKAQYQNPQGQEIIRGFEGKTPLRRSVEPEEVADEVLHLLSKRGSAITGQDRVVDCGYTRGLWDPGWNSK